MTKSTSLRRGASAIALGVALTALLPGAALAQDADTAPTAEEGGAEGGEDEIVVSGFRASLQSAVNAKKTRDQVVESISAEDIGKLPDASIAESIARLPGLTSQRVSGRSNSISIRGFAPDFSTTLLNGREQTSTGDNRAVEYDQYPSEVVNQVLVYKSPMASIVGQGLSGTVDLKTIRPLEYGKRVFSIGGRGTWAEIGKLNVGSKKYGYRVNGTYVDQFADDTIGIALSASYLDEPYQIQEFNAWGYAGNGTLASPVVLGGSKSYATSTQLKRLGLQGTLEWQPTPNFTSTFDAFYSDFSDDQIKRGIELPLAFGGAGVNITDVDDSGEFVFARAGTFTNVEGVVRNDVFERNAKLYSFGWNNRWEGDDGWNAYADISMSKTDRNELILESNSGTGRGGGVGATDTIGFTSDIDGTFFRPTLNYGDYNLIQLTSPLGWGGDQTGVNGGRIRGGQDGYYNNRIIEDELWQYRVEIERELEGFLKSVQFGVNYTTRTKQLTPDEAFVGLTANTDGLTSLPVPTQFRRGTTDLAYLGLGPVISYDPRDLLAAGIYTLVPNPYGDVVVKAYNVAEKQMTTYLQANIDQEMGSSVLTGNFGVQAIFTDQNSTGASATFAGTNPNGSPNIQGIPRRESTDYIDVLPSVNLSLRTASDFVIRASVAREIVRPRLDDLRATLSYGTVIGDPGGMVCPTGRSCAVVRGGSGNPDLRPWRANAADVTLEKYFGSSGYVAVQFFYKDLKSYIYNQDIPFDFTGYPIQAPGNDTNGLPIIVNYMGTVNAPVNGEGGKLYGAELAGSLPFSTFTTALDGFGVTGGVSYTKTKISPNPGAPAEDIPGYSKWVANGTAYFEKWGVNARVSARYRSSFIGELSGFGGQRVRRRARAETIIDAQLGYDFQPGSALEGLSVFVQGQNLTNEPFVTDDPRDARAVIDYQTYGRRYLAGASFKF
ncbi:MULTISPECIES: TonB-dependent receptor [unclassified Sphingopyxis]|uniref:TonB-dependent receptor n=1 Tax=unclassified Sphingopyxis TaxID=2614943 RepID=UPI002862D931|nr:MULTISPECIES: TonB-dependent receptor [unclassified Sphingopyxis]MDR6833789.1 iron complex outermembrane receptor protein [Sphingopyxis sp. BE122]MDR7226058.1 iron complex outermembrane receptor protein [Sphingopyxis sp. BE259]